RYLFSLIFTDSSTTLIYSLSLHDALPILLDRHQFTPLFLATGDGPLVSALRERDVEIVQGTVRELTPRAPVASARGVLRQRALLDRKSTRLNSSHSQISYAVFCLKKKKQ